MIFANKKFSWFMKRHSSFKIKDIQVVMLLVFCCNIHGFHGVRCIVYKYTVYLCSNLPVLGPTKTQFSD